MKIEILGSDAGKCEQLINNLTEANKTLKLTYEVVNVTDSGEISKRGLVITPALAVDGTVKIIGVSDVDEITKILGGK